MGFKHFIRYIVNKKVKPLCTMLPKLVDMQKVLTKLNIYLFVKR